MSFGGGKYRAYKTVDGTTCSQPGCELERMRGSIMCPRHSLALRNPDSGSNKTSDGVNPGGGQRKLTDDDVAEMRRMWSQFKSQREIAAHFRVSTNTVRKYLRQSRSAS